MNKIFFVSKNGQFVTIVGEILLLLCTVTSAKAQTGFSLDESLEKAIKEDDHEQANLADYYLRNKDYSEAVKWFNTILDNSKAGLNHRGYAYYGLGYMYRHGLGQLEKSIPKALELWRMGDKCMYPSCAVEIMNYYLNKDGEPIDKDSVQKWTIRAANLKDEDACYIAGNLFEKGTYTLYYKGGSNKEKKQFVYIIDKKDIDFSKAYRYYYNFAIFPFMDGTRRLPIVFRPQTLFKLACWNYKGKGSIHINYETAVWILTELLVGCEFNSSDNTFLYEGNESLKLDYREKPLSDDQWGEVYWDLATCYWFGRGIAKNPFLGERYAIMAANKGNTKAKEYLEKNK